MINFLVGVTILFIVINLYYFFTNKTYRKSHFSTALFLKLFFVLCGVLIGFGILYYLLSLKGMILVDNLTDRKPIEPTIWNMLYFSGVTMLSVGYGDMLPVGITRFFALIQSGIGILLPTAYFMKTFDSSETSQEQ
ncbi:ion channel [Alkalihalobacillus sp. TS-13]|uniref:ion channel n=1 Tax=Alkalihalobacillus sp. TS-13 TaxID=2842455 RepID=UPI001C87D33B|nr:ion channel [Alkalihalobacillus sp. TS-13]